MFLNSKIDKINFLEKDARARQINLRSFKSRTYAKLTDKIWNFHILLRKYEFLKNKKKNPLEKILYHVVRYRFRVISIKLGFSIPPNVCGPGLCIPHYGTIIINGNAQIGANCMIHACVNIGATGGSSKAPIIGKNVFIGPGAKIYGDIVIADNCYIGANAVVNKSVEQKNSVIVGIPAKAIKIDPIVWWKKNRLDLD